MHLWPRCPKGAGSAARTGGICRAAQSLLGSALDAGAVFCWASAMDFKFAIVGELF